MSLIFLFRKLVTIQVLLGIGAFCMAERNPGLLLVAGSLGLLAWDVVEGPSGKPLKQWLITLGVLASVVWLVFDLYYQRGQVMLAMGHFVLWLQVLMLYGRKSNREYAQILVLSLLLMIAGSMLNDSMLFGVMLVIYCIFALFSVLIFQLKTTSDTVLEKNKSAAPAGTLVIRPKAVVTRGHRWHFRIMASGVGLICATIAVVVFLLMPRSDRLRENSVLSSPISQQIGFSDEIRLGGPPPATGSREAILAIKIRRDMQPDRGGSAWLIRGAVMDQYNARNTTWQRNARIKGMDRTVEMPENGIVDMTEFFRASPNVRTKIKTELDTKWSPGEGSGNGNGNGNGDGDGDGDGDAGEGASHVGENDDPPTHAVAPASRIGPESNGDRTLSVIQGSITLRAGQNKPITLFTLYPTTRLSSTQIKHVTINPLDQRLMTNPQGNRALVYDIVAPSVNFTPATKREMWPDAWVHETNKTDEPTTQAPTIGDTQKNTRPPELSPKLSPKLSPELSPELSPKSASESHPPRPHPPSPHPPTPTPDTTHSPPTHHTHTHTHTHPTTTTTITPTTTTRPTIRPSIRPSTRPAAHRIKPHRTTEAKRLLMGNYARYWPVQTSRVERLAQSVIEPLGLSRGPQERSTPNDWEIVESLANFLRDDFTYDLTNPPAPKSTDPVIQFLFRDRRGHCELFASGLAAMLRSIGLPTRLVTGYYASEYNAIGGYYVVRQSHAHAWCEVNLIDSQGQSHWLPVDATPAAAVADEHASDSGWFSGLRALYEHAEFAWLRSVVSYDQQSRNQMISSVQAALENSKNDPKSWYAPAINWLKKLPDLWRYDRVSGSIMAAISLSIVLGMASLIRILVVRRRRLAALQLTHIPGVDRRRLIKQLRFYLIMLDKLDRHGYVRPAWQTPFGFAEELAHDNPLRFDPVLALTIQFYEIRFGHRPLDGPRLQLIKAHLQQLDDNLLGRNGVNKIGG